MPHTGDIVISWLTWCGVQTCASTERWRLQCSGLAHPSSTEEHSTPTNSQRHERL